MSLDFPVFRRGTNPTPVSVLFLLPFPRVHTTKPTHQTSSRRGVTIKVPPPSRDWNPEQSTRLRRRKDQSKVWVPLHPLFFSTGYRVCITWVWCLPLPFFCAETGRRSNDTFGLLWVNPNGCITYVLSTTPVRVVKPSLSLL